MTIEILNTEITIRPSSVDSFYNCSYQWGRTFLTGESSMPGARAAIGTAIHAAVEDMWQESILTGKKDTDIDRIVQAGVQSWQEQNKEYDLQFDRDEDSNTGEKEVIAGTTAFIDDIAPFVQIPDAVEQRFTMPLDHQLVKALSGTVDYIGNKMIADVKTSKRKPVPANYSTQQSIYKLLAEHEGVEVKHNTIQGVVLKKAPEGMVLPMETNIPAAKAAVNMILDTLDVVCEDIAPIELILRPNPKYYLCSKKYCRFHGDCPATNTATKTKAQVAIKL